METESSISLKNSKSGTLLLSTVVGLRKEIFGPNNHWIRSKAIPGGDLFLMTLTVFTKPVIQFPYSAFI